MTERYKSTGLWLRSLGSASDSHKSEVERLRTAYAQFREKASQLTKRIGSSVPSLTIHDVTHLDALWETADLIAGPEYPINPIEGFVFGGAILLHDSALCFEAYDGGLEGLRQTVEWKDAYAAAVDRNSDGTQAECEDYADFAALRSLHAHRARVLGTKEWKSDAGSIYLIDDYELRKIYGEVIGQIAESHNWTIEKVASNLRSQINAPGGFPQEWRIDPIKLACLLRCADASHVDDRRAPDFLRALIRQRGVSESHWRAQNWLARADIDRADSDGKSIVITSTRAFGAKDTEAWWIAYDAVQLIDAEIKYSNELLASRPQANVCPPFKIERVTGASSIERLCRHITVEEWKPCSANIHVGNVEKLVSQLGGSTLYGGEPLPVVLRELIQNARDAIVALGEIKEYTDYGGRVRVRLRSETEGSQYIDVIDNGIGMSERVMTGPLLDFGTSFWTSELVRLEWPGLRSSKFRPVGQFGIGFYSIFMVADNVVVRSRRYNSAYADVSRLEFRNGLTLRPTLSKEEIRNEEFSTMVSFRLKAPIGEKIHVRTGLFGAAGFDVAFEDFIAGIVVGLDVKVDVLVGDRIAGWKSVHVPPEALLSSEQQKQWLAALSFSAYTGDQARELVEQNHHRLRKIRDGDNIVGLAALCTNIGYSIFCGTRTVGGLSAHRHALETEAFIGYIDYIPNSARREAGSTLRASKKVLSAWAEEQIEILKSEGIGEMEWCSVTLSLCDLGLDPLPIMKVAMSFESTLKFYSIPAVLDVANKSGFIIKKSAHLDHIQTGSPLRAVVPVFHALRNSAFLDLSRDENVPKSAHSFIGCLHRYAVAQGMKLEFVVNNVIEGRGIESFQVMVVTAKPSST